MRNNRLIKTKVGKSVLINKKFSISVKAGDILNLGGIGGSFQRKKEIEYKWTEIVYPEKVMAKK